MNWSDALIQLQYSLGAPAELSWLVEGITYFVGALIMASVALTIALLLIWITRKVISRIQDRIGPNRLGPYRLVSDGGGRDEAAVERGHQADAVRTRSFTWQQLLPVLSVVGVLMALAVIPFGAGLIGADLNVGVLYLVALGSIGIMAALMAGWGSNNKYALLAGFRVVAQLLSYEIPMVLAMFAPVLLVGTMRMQELSQAQSHYLGSDQSGAWLVRLLTAGRLSDLLHLSAGRERTDALRPA
jgi:NADH-quinone oxidoreductase subunit H